MLQGLTLFEQVSIWSVLGISVLGLLCAFFLRRQILREDKGSKEMRKSGMPSARARILI